VWAGRFMDSTNNFVNWLADGYGTPVIAIGAAFFLGAHLLQVKRRDTVLLAFVFIVCAVTIFIIQAFSPLPMTFARMSSLVFIYGVASFVALSTLLTEGLAPRLTKWRGEKWVKELDYVYLTLGCAGILASVNRLSFVTGKIDAGDLIAPVLLTTAIVIRFIKTRADIGGWNKLADTAAPASPSEKAAGPLTTNTR
jgi:hypothetical protein